MIGIAVALLVYAGLRSGARGGPLAIEAAEVRYTLLAPVSRRTALRPAALAQLRIATISGAIFGAVVGNFVFRRFPGSAVEWIGSLAAFGAAGPDRRARRGAGRLRATAALGRRERASAWCWSPGRRSTWRWAGTARRRRCSVTWRRCRCSSGTEAWRSPRSAAALALAVLAVGLLGIGGLRLEAARRRAELVAEMRFSASVQDLRTVILLRRQLASEHPRRRPGSGSAEPRPANPIWRRDWQSYLRWPVVRIVRVVLIAVAAGGLAVGGFDLTPVLFALPGPLLLVAALDLIEPLAQESDHPTRRLLLPFTAADLIRRHLWRADRRDGVRLAIATVDRGGRRRRPGPGARRRRRRLRAAGRGAGLRGGGQRHQRPLRVRPQPAARPRSPASRRSSSR